MHIQKTIPQIKPPPCKTRTEIAMELGVSPRTLRRKVKEASLNITPGLLTYKEQREIYQLFGKMQSNLDNHISYRKPY